jgi:hypothetical protein
MGEWEIVEDGFGESGSFRQRWVGCNPPGPVGGGVLYRVTREEWNVDFTERTIYEYALVEDVGQPWVQAGAHRRQESGTP